MYATAVIFQEPGKLVVDEVALADPADDDLIVDVDWSGISTGTEKLLWTGEMPPFPGLGYPLVPGYETVGTVVDARAHNKARIGERVFVPGSAAYQDVRGLFGGAASRIIVPSQKAPKVNSDSGQEAVLLALAATAHHALGAAGAKLPELIVGHGVLGRLLARLTIAKGGRAPVVWDIDPARRDGALGYDVRDPASDAGASYASIYDVSGSSNIIDQLVGCLSPGGEIVLAGFYSGRLDFAFPPAFMKEARLRVAAEWRPEDMVAVQALLDSGALTLGGLVTHSAHYQDAQTAYTQAFNDPACLKMILNWKTAA